MSIELTFDEKRRIQEALDRYKEAHPDHKVVFATVSGSHLFGTKTDDADVDLRGCYILPTEKLLGLEKCNETTEFVHSDVEFQFHEVGKFLRLLLGSNMNFVEYLKSDLKVLWSKEADELLKIAEQTISKEMFNHIQGMSIHTWKHAEKEHFLLTKRDLYLYREILRGLVLFQDGVWLADVEQLALHYDDVETKKWVGYLLDKKRNGLTAEPRHVKLIKENIQALQNKMLTQKEFSSLAFEKKLDLRKINGWLLNIRKENFKSEKVN